MYTSIHLSGVSFVGFEQCPAHQRLMDPVGSGGGMQQVGRQACKYLQVAGWGRMLMEPLRENPQTSHPEGWVTKWRPVGGTGGSGYTTQGQTLGLLSSAAYKVPG